jgi:hypothetical protein
MPPASPLFERKALSNLHLLFRPIHSSNYRVYRELVYFGSLISQSDDEGDTVLNFADAM